ncbi:lysM and peptidoglycan-binding domain-containing 3 [Pelobates cultripes]|uniref:LysM and peptidoglycan-binding domain-containing 3 n=1 Tax=Pelobates cultripes TaxID=61616 RepID=A0AAD1W915_PELCU|nr:lysM and peptidoglycan-binding domain-containing 3 [Pelobates cultripes]
MTGRIPTRSYLKPTSTSATTGGHNYHFADTATSENDTLEEDADKYELRPRGREKAYRSTSKERLDDIILIGKDICEGDTLNSIALQYSCTVADLKRVNNFINEQDFFALRSIKIPVKRFSVLTESHFSPKVKPSRTLSFQASLDPQESDQNIATLPSDNADSFFQEVDRDIENIVKSTDTKKENLHEVVSALTQDVSFVPELKPAKRKDPYFGADWGLGWWTAVVIMVIVGIVTPVFYFLYYELFINVETNRRRDLRLMWYSTEGETRKVVTFSIMDDSDPEGKESIIIRLTQTDGGSRILPSSDTITIVILANDYVAGLISFQTASRSVIGREGERLLFNVFRTPPGHGNVTVHWKIIGQRLELNFENSTGLLHFPEVCWATLQCEEFKKDLLNSIGIM